MLIAPTVGILQSSIVESSAGTLDFIAEILGDILDQTRVIAKQLGEDAAPGRVVYIGKNSDNPGWISCLKERKWTCSSVSPEPKIRDSDLTYDVRIDPRSVVASNVEILIILGDRAPKDAALLRSLLSETLVVTQKPKAASHRYFYFNNTELEPRSHADFCLAVRNLVSGNNTPGAPQEIESIDFGRRGFSFGGVFPSVIRVLARQPHRVTFRFRPPFEVEADALKFCDHSSLRPGHALDEARRRIVPAFVRSDEAGLYYGDRYRSLILLALFLTLVAFLALISGHLFGRFNLWWSVSLRVVEVASLVGILVAVIVGRGRRMHRKWLIHRMIAELLRPTQYLLPLWLRTSWSFNFPERSRELSSALAYQRQAIREASPLHLHIDQSYLDDMRHVILDLLQNQITWHKRNAGIHEKCQKAFVRANVIFFFFLVMSGFLSLLTREESFWANLWFVLASVCTLCISISAACIHYFSFDHISERSEVALRRCQALQNHVSLFAPDVSYPYIKLWMQSASDIMADEQLDWFRQTSRLLFWF